MSSAPKAVNSNDTNDGQTSQSGFISTEPLPSKQMSTDLSSLADLISTSPSQTTCANKPHSRQTLSSHIPRKITPSSACGVAEAACVLGGSVSASHAHSHATVASSKWIRGCPDIWVSKSPLSGGRTRQQIELKIEPWIRHCLVHPTGSLDGLVQIHFADCIAMCAQDPVPLEAGDVPICLYSSSMDRRSQWHRCGRFL